MIQKSTSLEYEPSSEPLHISALVPLLRPVAHNAALIWQLDRRGTARAEDAQGTPTQSHISPSIPLYEESQDTPTLGMSKLAKDRLTVLS